MPSSHPPALPPAAPMSATSRRWDGIAWSTLAAVALFAAQVALSRVWLRHFRFGPMEWLWRAITYWRLPPLRRIETDA